MHWGDGKPGGRGPAVARRECPDGNVLRLCRTCLDAWFDNADEDPSLEPAAWSWLPGREKDPQ